MKKKNPHHYRQTFHSCFDCFIESNCVFCSDRCLAWFIARPLKALYCYILRLFALQQNHCHSSLSSAPTALDFPAPEVYKEIMNMRKSIHTVPSHESAWQDIILSHKGGEGEKNSAVGKFSAANIPRKHIDLIKNVCFLSKSGRRKWMVLFVNHPSSPLVYLPDGTALRRRRNNKQRVSCAVSLLIII